MIVLEETINKLISDNRKQEWKRIERELFIKQETKNKKCYYVRTT